MSMHSALASHLLNDSDIALIVQDRVFRMVAERNAKAPFITFQRISETREPHMTGSSGLVSGVYQIDCFALDGNEVLKLAEAVRQSLDGMIGTSIGLQPSAGTLSAAFLTGETDDYEDPTDSSERGLWRVTMTWDLKYTESLPRLAV